MTNLFDDAEATFLVLLNAEGQHSIWPEFVDVPDGWKAVWGPASRTGCVEYVDVNWTDMRPVSIR